ncbi:unnamed protein product [Taenia asiatica]|uniref:DUF5726 domain-containing protein n=1 Tax=Taenia asiatica TaxID=60517 RepID=A0A3P6QA42_TAEAS|nr:unnamed protein product [Taenia asiatica]
MLLHALPQELLLSAIRAGVTPDSDIDHCCEIISQLGIVQRERSLAREFFHRDQKVGLFRGCPPAKVTGWVAVQFCTGVQPPSISARLNAMKTDDPNQLVKAATKMRQEIPLTPAPQTSHRRPNQPRPRWIPPRQTPRAVQYRKGTTHANADALSRRPLSAERESGIVVALFLSEPTRHQWRDTQGTDPDTALLYERFLASSHKPTAEEMKSSSKAAKQIWRQWPKLTLEDEVLWYQEDATFPKRLLVPGSLIQTVARAIGACG